MTVQGVLGGPLIVLIIVLSSFWFGREPLDYFQTQIYRPAVEAWTEAHNEHLKRLSQVSREEKVCYLNGGSWDTCRELSQATDPASSSNHDKPGGGGGIRERTCAEEMRERVRILTQTKGLTGPDPGGKYKAMLKEEFVANMKAIKNKCQKSLSSPKCNSNLSPFSQWYISDLNKCWCPVSSYFEHPSRYGYGNDIHGS